MQKMKTNLENVSEDKHFFQQQLFKAKKVNKALIIELEHFRDGNVHMAAIDQEEKPLSLPPSEHEESKLSKREDSLDEILDAPLAIKNEAEDAQPIKDYVGEPQAE